MAMKKAYARRPARKGRKVAPRKRVARKSVAKIARSVITRMAEKKQVRYNWEWSFGSIATGSWAGNALQPLTPLATYTDIAQGTGQANRIGNKIRTSSLVFDGVIYPTRYNATTNPAPRPNDVMMVIFSDKEDPNTFNSLTMPNFFQSGNTSIAPTGNIIDTILPINTDRYTVHYKRMFKVGYASFDGTGSVPAAQNYNNNDYKFSCRFRVNCTKYMPKILRFNDSNNTPNSRVIRVAFLPCYADGLVMPTVAQTITVAANWTYQFTDL